MSKENTSKKADNSALRKTNVIRRFLEEVSKEKNIPIERHRVGVMLGELYVWDYNSGRHDVIIKTNLE